MSGAIRTIEQARRSISVACDEFAAENGECSYDVETCFVEALLDVNEVDPAVAAMLRREYGLG